MSTTRTTETASAVSQGQGRKPGLQVTAENERGISIRRKPCGKRDQHDRYHNRGHSEPFLFVARLRHYRNHAILTLGFHSPIGKLLVVETGVGAVLAEQYFVRAALDDLAALDH